MRIVVSGLRGEESIAALCRREGIAEGLYYSWSKEFLEAGKKRLAGDTGRQATSGEVKGLRKVIATLVHERFHFLVAQIVERVLPSFELFEVNPGYADSPTNFDPDNHIGSVTTSASEGWRVIEIYRTEFCV